MSLLPLMIIFFGDDSLSVRALLINCRRVGVSPGGKQLCACANPRAPLLDLQLQLDINPCLSFFSSQNQNFKSHVKTGEGAA